MSLDDETARWWATERERTAGEAEEARARYVAESIDAEIEAVRLEIPGDAPGLLSWLDARFPRGRTPWFDVWCDADKGHPTGAKVKLFRRRGFLGSEIGWVIEPCDAPSAVPITRVSSTWRDPAGGLPIHMDGRPSVPARLEVKCWCGATPRLSPGELSPRIREALMDWGRSGGTRRRVQWGNTRALGI